MLKFKKIPASQTVYVRDGYATNRHWIFRIDWLNTLAKSRGNIQVRNRAKKAMLAANTARLLGNDYDKLDVSQPVSQIVLTEYRAASASEFETVQGYIKGDQSNYGAVAFRIGGVPCLDIEYFPALQWDSGVTVMVKGKHDPVVILSGGEIVGLIAPIKSTYKPSF